MIEPLGVRIRPLAISVFGLRTTGSATIARDALG